MVDARNIYLINSPMLTHLAQLLAHMFQNTGTLRKRKPIDSFGGIYEINHLVLKKPGIITRISEICKNDEDHRQY